MEEEVEEEVVTVGEEVEMGVVFGVAEVADGDIEELLALVVMLLILSAYGISTVKMILIITEFNRSKWTSLNFTLGI